MRAMLHINIHQPARVNGALARPQSLLLLLLLWLRHRESQSSSPVSAAELAALFPNALHLRMVISRAFVDFARWGIRVGWGEQMEAIPELLDTRNRNRGPFWLPAAAFIQITIARGTRTATLSDVRNFLQLADDDRQTSLAEQATRQTSLAEQATRPTTRKIPARSLAAPPEFWSEFAIAKRAQLDGHLIIDGTHGALAGFRRLHALSSDPEHQAFALLQQAMVWRRAGNPEAATNELKAMKLQLQRMHAPHWLEAMANVVQAWCAYANRNVARAERVLLAAERNTRLAVFFAHHPRVQSEQANLHALLQRARALNDVLNLEFRKQAAHDALSHYQRALTLACEAELFDIATSVASNLGWSIWLFARCGLSSASHEAQTLALQWIGLAEVLNAQHGSGINLWNQIYLLRIVRNGGPVQTRPKLRPFQQHSIISAKQYAQMGAQSVNKRSWLSLIQNLDAQIEQGKLQVDALQRANVLLELAWYEAHEGNLAAARTAVARLTKRLIELVQSDRDFFRSAVRCLPTR